VLESGRKRDLAAPAAAGLTITFKRDRLAMIRDQYKPRPASISLGICGSTGA
jgi:hypothetical protein